MNILSSILSKIIPSWAKAHADSSISTTASADSSAQHVDVEKILLEMQSHSSQSLNWRTSIVDLMKLLGMDSDLSARKQLARELNFTGDMNDSAKMNIWLHQQVMKKLQENGGKIPESMKH